MNKDDKKYYRQLALHYENGAKLSGFAATVHVEAYDDCVFWNKILKHFLPGYSFDYIFYTKTPKGTVATGCSACLKYFESECLSKHFFICIDSDYRWLLQEPNLNVKHFVFQTYTYSIENHYCFIKNIENVFNKMNLTNDLFNIPRFLEAFSQSLYQAFMYHLLSIKKSDNLFTSKDFNILINKIEVESLNQNKIISELENQVNSKTYSLRKKYNKNEIQALENTYSQLGLTNKNTYLYFRGHNLFPLIVKLIEKIQKELETKKNQNYTNAQKANYFSKIKKPVKNWLKEEIYFDQYFEINKIKADTEIYKQL